MTTQPKLARYRDFLIVLHSDVVVSQNNSTAGQHQSLDYLPGSNLLGLAAQRGYARLDAETAWNVFHSGHLRFGDALPLTAHNQCTWPVSLSLHHFKGDTPADSRGKLDPLRLFDPSHSDGETDQRRQPQQFRKGYISADGAHFQPHMGSRMKTAIDADTARAAESQLFGYQAITEGQQFVFRLEADEAIAEETFNQVTQWLTGPARLGRSRSAQYGRAEIMPFDQGWQWPATASHADTLTLWLMSDLCLLDHAGQPTFRPEPWMFNLPEGSQWHEATSFLRTRRYSPYNGKRRTHDDERQVIARGSVLRFTLPRPLTGEEQNNLSWAGLYNEAGLGRLAVNPAMLAGVHPAFEEGTTPAGAAETTAPAEPASALIDLLKRRANQASTRQITATLAKDLESAFNNALLRARHFHTLQTGEPLDDAPGRSQWGQIRELANQNRSNPAKLYGALFEGENALIRQRSGWQLLLAPDQRLCDEIPDWMITDPAASNASTADKNRVSLKNLKTHPLLPDIIGQWATRLLEGKTGQIIAGTDTRKEELTHD